MKLIHKIILGFFVIILLIWVVEYFALSTGKRALKKSIEESSELLAVKIMDEIDKNIYRRIEETQLYAKDFLLQRSVLVSNQSFEHLGDVEEYINKIDREWISVPKGAITPFMHQIISNDLSKELRARKKYYEAKYGYPVFSEIIVTNKYGANVGQTGKTTDYRQDDERWWQAAKEERFYLRDIGYDESADVYSIDFGIRIDDKDGDFIGVMKVVLNIEEVISILRKPHLTGIHKEHTRTGWKLLTHDGRLIYSSGDFKFLSRISDELLSQLKKQDTGSFMAVSSTQVKRKNLVSYASSNVKGLDWILAIEHDTEEIFLPIDNLRNGILIISLAVTIFAILTGFLVSRYISRPVTKLRDAAIEIGKGNLDTQIEVRSRDEIGLLAQTFRQMASNIASDITELKRTQSALRESEQKYRLLFEESKDVVYMSTPEGKFLDINQAGIELFGYASKDDILRIDIIHDLYVNPADREKIQQILEKQGFIKDYEVVFKRKDFQHVTVLLTANAVKDEKGLIITYRGIMTDITERKRLEQQLIQAQKMEAVGQLAGGIAHDFNNILTAIIGFGTLLKIETETSDLQRSYLTQILSAAERASNLTHALLAFSRKQIISPKQVNINEIILGVKNLLSRLIGEDIELSIFLADKGLTVMADGSQMEHVFMNLATNARDAMPDGGRLTISTERVELDREFIRAHGYGKPGAYVLISIEDSGSGIEEETKKRIFEPFFTTKDLGKGTGLGLSIAYGIIKQHDGLINVYSHPGIGTTFKIYLPLIRSKIEEMKPADITVLKGGTETVLIAEDDVQVRELTKKVLAGFGYKVFEAKDGADAVKVFNEHKDEIKLLILDVIMPKKNGKEVHDEIKKLRTEVKTIFISGYTADMIHKKGILEEGLNFISKPILPDELLRRVRDVLDE
jgi:PAS domain S-box-containing protein